jgi:protein-S-isoprenylcysteine O-methyltransferase Ste14
MKKLELLIPPVIVFLFVGILMWLVAYFMPDHQFEFRYQYMLVIDFVFVGAVVALFGVVGFRQAKTTVNPMTPEKSETLVNQGVYSYTRNPMYLGMALVLVGLVFLLGNWMTLVGIPVFVVYMTYFQIKPEERVLEQKFGEDFHLYVQKVRRWI